MEEEIKSKYHQDDKEIKIEQSIISLSKTNPQKFEWLYNKYYERIFSFVYQRIDSKDAAFDITSQVFMNALINIKKYEDRGLPFSAWLFRIATNELNQQFRKKKLERALNVELEQVTEILTEIEKGNTEQHIQKLLNTVIQLPEENLSIIEMRFFEKRSFKEIGDILSITENNAKVRTYRILDRLKKSIGTL